MITCPRCGQPYPDAKFAGGRTLTCHCGAHVSGPRLARPDVIAPPFRFFADVMLGRLAVYLRLLGYDTRYEHAIADDALVAQSLAEHRILLTRDHALVARWNIDGIVLVPGDKPREQLAFLATIFPLAREAHPFTRCSACNVPVQQGLETGHGPEALPGFSHCPSCGRLYWPGSHVARLQAMFRDTLGESRAT